MTFPKIYKGKFCPILFLVISVNYSWRYHFLTKVILVKLKILYILMQWSKWFIFWNKKKSTHDFHDDVIKWWQKWHLSTFLSRLISYCQYTICTKFHVKWTKTFSDTACFFTAGLLIFSKKPSPGRVKKHCFKQAKLLNNYKIH